VRYHRTTRRGCGAAQRRDALLEFDVERWRLPVRDSTTDWGYGTTLVAVRDTTSVLLSLPAGGPRTAWCIVDLAAGRIIRGTGMPGHLRAAVFPPSHAADPRPWVLGTFGLGRLQLEPRPAVTDVVRKGLGAYHSRLIGLGPELLGVGHHRGQSLALLRTLDGGLVKRVRVAGPGVGYPLSGGRVRILGLHYGQASDLDTTTGKVVARHSVPYGTDAIHIDETVIVVIGERRAIRVVTDVRDAPREGTVVVSAGPQHDTDSGVDLGWDVLPRRIAVIGATALDVRREAPAPRGTVQVLGLDRCGRIVISTHSGLTLLDQRTLTPIADYRATRQIIGAVLCPRANTAALLGAEDDPYVLSAVHW
jgi:hypothetical protein